ncbi:3-methyl-2-oxobutanoate hydroxymethyltransferase [Niveibacterium umoris]|uniref:3-methyl-2-oxobutanoate hydroxymethyltransferase n=1 Tax=Niveibacterium umoris TaxID=1193620 RepID=A0A840BFB7_9RHOO|nr:3-methyl-2-oxobutanoate hydroxymethyltransferase [Niveibacterium umoris]MBB4011865.1 3-methyl-2-oxobutanoate hydroxymethyltransferase [Niveibacterium umoris]
MTYLQNERPVTLTELAKMRTEQRKIAMLTAYDASFAALLERSGVDVILVGDSLGNVLQGHGSTLPVTIEQMVYHTQCVARGCKRPMIIADMPFGSYQESPAQAFRNAALLMAAGAHMVKLEGGAYMAETVRFLVERGIPVCAHIGLTPQAVNQLGGYRVQGRTEESARRLKDDALALEAAGAALVVLEMVPATLASEVSAALKSMATIGIGAGKDTDGQVLVLHDLLGVFPGKKARFVRNFMDGASSIEQAVTNYVVAVKDGSFPAAEHVY